MDLLHQVQKILQCAVFRVHGAVVPVGIGAAQASFFVQLPNRVDGHKPYNIHPQCRYPVQVRLYRLKGPLRCVAAYIYFIDHAAPQRIVGIYGHGVSSFIWAFFLGRPIMQDINAKFIYFNKICSLFAHFDGFVKDLALFSACFWFKRDDKALILC